MGKIKAQGSDREQYVVLRCLEAVAGDGICTQFPSSFTTKDRQGIEIIEVECYLDQLQLAADTDAIAWGLTQLFRGGVPPDLTQLEGYTGLVYGSRTTLKEVGAAASGFIYNTYDRHIFAEPFLVHPAALFGFVQGFGPLAVVNVLIRVGYRMIPLDADAYNDILQTIIVQNAI